MLGASTLFVRNNISFKYVLAFKKSIDFFFTLGSQRGILIEHFWIYSIGFCFFKIEELDYVPKYYVEISNCIDKLCL